MYIDSKIMLFLDDNDHKQVHYKLGKYCNICDNFLDKNDFNTMKNVISDFYDGNLKWGHSSVGYHPYTYTHYSTDLTHINFFNTYMLKIIEETFNKKLSVLRVYSSMQSAYDYGNFHIDDNDNDTFTFTTYFDLPTNGCTKNHQNRLNDYYDVQKNDCNTKNSSFEIETYKKSYNSKEKYDNDKLDAICEAFNEKNHNGNFEIKIPNTTYIHSVPFVPNRAVLFPSKLVHNGSPFNDNIKRIRCVLAFKLVATGET